jgi:hypothetical protein
MEKKVNSLMRRSINVIGLLARRVMRLLRYPELAPLLRIQH